ncbi:MAG: histidine phosphatase family protein [Actinomycetota bacterium]
MRPYGFTDVAAMLIVVRHGRTEANANGLLVGRRIDPGLDEVGRRQAQALRTVLSGAARVISSPLLRARETADALGLPMQVDERWIEIDYGTFDGMPLADLPAATWVEWRADTQFALEGGESLAAVGERVRSAAEELVEECRDRDVVVVTHVSPIKAVTAWALGVDDETIWRMYCAPGSITEIGTAGATPTLRAYNSTAHLSGL